MGVDYTAVLMVGKEFDSEQEAADFLREHSIDIPDEESDEMVDGLSEYVSSADGMPDGLEWKTLNAYTSESYGVLGFSPDVRNIDGFAEQVKGLQGKWQELFKETPELIHTVEIW